MAAESQLIQSISALENATSEDEYINALGLYEVARKRWHDLDSAFKEARIAYHENHGDVTTPDGRRFYVATLKRVKARDIRKLADAVLSATGGDIDAFADALSTNAFKHGHCRELLQDHWHEHFKVEEVKDVKTGKAKKAVQLADDRYLTR